MSTKLSHLLQVSIREVSGRGSFDRIQSRHGQSHARSISLSSEFPLSHSETVLVNSKVALLIVDTDGSLQVTLTPRAGSPVVINADPILVLTGLDLATVKIDHPAGFNDGKPINCRVQVYMTDD